MDLLTKSMAVIGAVHTAAWFAYAIFLRIPGDQPDKTIKWIYDVTGTLSKKPEK